MFKSKGKSGKWVDLLILSCVLGLFAGLFYIFAPARQLTDQIIIVKKGEPIVLNFNEQNSHDMRWQFNKGKSKGLEHVSVHFLGWTTETGQNIDTLNPSGKIRNARFEVRGLTPGRSFLTFEYRKLGAPSSSLFGTSQTHKIEVQ